MQENMFTNWLNKRGITNKVIEQFNVHIDTHTIIGECIFIPVYDIDGNFSFNKYRRNPTSEDKPKYLYDKGSKVSLYAINHAIKSDTILITEGELDTLVAWSANIPAVSSTGGSMSFQDEWVEILKNKDIYICYDNDEAGGSGMAKVFNLLPQAKLIFLPDKANVKDISDYVSSGGDIHELIRTAKKFQSIEEIKEDKAKRVALWQSTFFHDAYIALKTKPTYTPKNISDVKDIKDIPITHILEFKNNKAKCIWHNEHTPSLTYYPKTNTVYCFGCGKYGDVIEVYRQLHNQSFSDSVKNLKKLI